MAETRLTRRNSKEEEVEEKRDKTDDLQLRAVRRYSTDVLTSRWLCLGQSSTEEKKNKKVVSFHFSNSERTAGQGRAVLSV